jgi:hypothetical protein
MLVVRSMIPLRVMAVAVVYSKLMAVSGSRW